jgi:hypothetical protein
MDSLRISRDAIPQSLFMTNAWKETMILALRRVNGSIHAKFSRRNAKIIVSFHRVGHKQ